MKPYFDTNHLAGLLLLVVVMAWGTMELAKYSQGNGPYRLLRHPSYTGILLACIGVGLTSANWAALAGVTLPLLAYLLWRIHVEEKALLATLGDRYRAYASHHKRLVPAIW